MGLEFDLLPVPEAEIDRGALAYRLNIDVLEAAPIADNLFQSHFALIAISRRTVLDRFAQRSGRRPVFFDRLAQVTGRPRVLSAVFKDLRQQVQRLFGGR